MYPGGHSASWATMTPGFSPLGSQVASGAQAGSPQSVRPLQSSSTPLKHSSAPRSTHGAVSLPSLVASLVSPVSSVGALQVTSAVSWSRVSEEAVVVFPLDSEEADCVVFSTLSSLLYSSSRCLGRKRPAPASYKQTAPTRQSKTSSGNSRRQVSRTSGAVPKGNRQHCGENAFTRP